MKNVISTVSDLKESYHKLCISMAVRAESFGPFAVCAAIIGLVVLGTSEEASAQITNHPRYSEACNRLLGLMEGGFGALITVAAGVGAIIASAVGGFKMAWTLVVVAVGAFILRAYVTLFFQGCGGL